MLIKPKLTIRQRWYCFWYWLTIRVVCWSFRGLTVRECHTWANVLRGVILSQYSEEQEWVQALKNEKLKV